MKQLKKKFVKTGTLIMMLPGTMDRKQKQRKIIRTTKCDSTQPAVVKPAAEAWFSTIHKNHKI